MPDIVKRLRTEGAVRDYFQMLTVPALQREAADEIERLRRENAHLQEGQPQAQSRGGL